MQSVVVNHLLEVSAGGTTVETQGSCKKDLEGRYPGDLQSLTLRYSVGHEMELRT